MIELAKRGVGRQEGRENGLHMKAVLKSEVEVTQYISPAKIKEIMDLELYIGTDVEQMEAVVGR